MQILNRFLLPGLSVALILSLVSQRGRSQGVLAPQGPPAPSMKTLDQTEPRIPVSGPMAITTPGSYYLTGNILAGDDIASPFTITSSQVTFDLRGYSIFCANSTSGIEVNSGDQVVIQNGSIRGGAFGVSVADVNAGVGSVKLERLQITAATSAGISASGANRAIVVSDCILSNIGSTDPKGVVVPANAIIGHAGMTVRNCVIDTVYPTSGTKSCGLRLTADAFAIGNTISNCGVGINSGKIQNNLTNHCGSTFSGTTDAGGNN